MVCACAGGHLDIVKTLEDHTTPSPTMLIIAFKYAQHDVFNYLIDRYPHLANYSMPLIDVVEPATAPDFFTLVSSNVPGASRVCLGDLQDILPTLSAVVL